MKTHMNGMPPLPFPNFQGLTGSELQTLHLAALEVLRRTGVRINHQGARDMLKAAGAFVADGNVVRFPPAMVEDAIGSAPSRIVLCDRKGEPKAFLEGTQVNVGPGSDCPNMLDFEMGDVRPFTQKDLIQGYHLCDFLPNIDFVMSMGIPSDVDSAKSYDTQMALMLEHTSKPIVFVTDDYSTCKRAIDMAAAVAGGYEALMERPQLLLYSEPSSPLQQSDTAVEKLLLMAEKRVPIVHAPALLMGASGPITPAGGFAQGIAEALSSLVLHQLQSPGAPFVFGATVHHFDMGAMQTSYSGPEAQRSNTITAQLGRWYGLPTWGFAGCSDSKIPDEQAALEAMFTVMTAKLSGVNLAHDAGYLESGMTTSFEMLTLTDELVAMMDHMMPSIHIGEDTLLLDEIDRVGPGGSYLDSPETLDHFRDFWYPDLISRDIRNQWSQKGASTLAQRLHEKASRIIREHQPEPLSKEHKSKVWEIASSVSG